MSQQRAALAVGRRDVRATRCRRPRPGARALLAAALVLSACERLDSGSALGGDNLHPALEAAPSAMSPDAGIDSVGSRGASCPTAVRGVELEVQDTLGGVALSFWTAPEDTAALRERVQNLSQVYAGATRDRRLLWRRVAPPAGLDVDLEAPPVKEAMLEATIEMEAIDRGARLVFRPAEPAGLAPLRQRVREHRQRLESGECPVLEPQ